MLRYAVLVACGAMSSMSMAAPIVINEVYGGGGNSGAPLNQDFIELKNTTASAIIIAGYQVQYGSATGSVTTVGTVPAATSLAPGAYYLIAEGTASATQGSALPTPDLTGTLTGSALSATAGKVVLLDASSVQVDQVGYGPTANTFEGTGPAPAPSATLSIQRFIDGIDLGQNSTDFATASPTPRAVNTPEPTGLAGVAVVGLLLARRRRVA